MERNSFIFRELLVRSFMFKLPLCFLALCDVAVKVQRRLYQSVKKKYQQDAII